MTRSGKATGAANPKGKAAGAAASGNDTEDCETQPTHDAQDTQPTLGDLQKSILDFKNLISGKLDQISADITSVKASVEFNSTKITEIEKEKLPEIQNTIDQKCQYLENKILLLEIHNRKSNLLFYGIQQKDGENVYDVLKAAFVSLGIDNTTASGIAIANAHRLPRREPAVAQAAQASRPAPPACIIARFCYMRDRNDILRAFEEQQRKRNPTEPSNPTQAHPRVTVRTDLPPTMKARRGKLANEAYKLRKEKGVSTKIFVTGTKVQLQWKEKGTTKWNDHDV